ncbi:protein of unknown function [Taphrina deformans PYCC 5710]|uniref:Uncharacterized protein n=1 Tax=Taphrina deformans (strain PYCC 5710 / ATCC 11124 / CBS 356.35 / IMI 108563 / JCM 9778 / NBRC 8474) TaxID=1097556 RepID=R4XAY9_TAPDE|nr:protein of unknown function [Taphrina deformans PYCC 5710]|eukprot:CCG83034.1 protein of unknown function [Taphrina deformans PYCC 5710]
MDRLAPPLAHDFNDERRGSWTGDFEPSRRTSFANSFLETPPGPARGTKKFSLGHMHSVSLDEEPDLMGTPPISPMYSRNAQGPSSYFDTPTRSVSRKAVAKTAEQEASIFSNLLNKAFETVSKSGEAMDLHGRQVVDLSDSRRAAKGKARAISYDEDDEPPSSGQNRTLRTTSELDDYARASTESQIAPSARFQPEPKSAQEAASLSERDFYATHPFEAGLVNTLEAAEQKVTEWWSWLTSDTTSETTLHKPAA